MKKLIKNTTIALTLAAAMGATWIASGAYHANKASELQATPAVMVQNVSFTTGDMMSYMNEDAGYNLLDSVKDVLRPVKNYFFQSEVKTFNGVPVHQACVRITTNGITRFF